MKFIKGKYERVLRTHEKIENYDYKIGDYYLQYNYPNSFLVSLYQITIDKDFDDLENTENYSTSDYLISKEIANFNKDYIQNLSIKELKELVKKRGV